MDALEIGAALLGLTAMVSFVGWLVSAAHRRLDREEIDGAHQCVSQLYKAIAQVITERDSLKSLSENLKQELLQKTDQIGKLKPLLERESKDRAMYRYLLKQTNPRCSLCGRMMKRGYPWIEAENGPMFVCGPCMGNKE